MKFFTILIAISAQALAIHPECNRELILQVKGFDFEIQNSRVSGTQAREKFEYLKNTAQRDLSTLTDHFKKPVSSQVVVEEVVEEEKSYDDYCRATLVDYRVKLIQTCRVDLLSDRAECFDRCEYQTPARCNDY